MGVRKSLSLENTRISAYGPEHIDAIQEAVLESQVELSRWLPWAQGDYGLPEAAEFVEDAINQWELGSSYRVAIEDAQSGALLGSGGLEQVSELNRMAEIGYWVRSSATGQGHATRATRLLVELGLTDLGLHRLELVVALGNNSSLRVAQKAGATLEGLKRNRLHLHGEAVDAHLLSIIPQ
jgi:ribosomal-protein-serine acetyltransferase